jgi:hypothetical protein
VSWVTHAVNEIRDQMSDLIYSYRPDRSTRLPALLYSLDHTRTLTATGDRQGGNSNKPGSRPPANIDWPSTALEIRTQAVRWDAHLRHSEYERQPNLALRGVILNCDQADDHDLGLLRVAVYKWHRSSCLLLGYLDPDRDTPKQFRGSCFDCRTPAIYGVLSEGTAACYHCGAQYDQSRVWQLVRRYGN